MTSAALSCPARTDKHRPEWRGGHDDLFSTILHASSTRRLTKTDCKGAGGTLTVIPLTLAAIALVLSKQLQCKGVVAGLLAATVLHHQWRIHVCELMARGANNLGHDNKCTNSPLTFL